MNRYALWKYILIAVVLIVAALYTLPNFYGESPAVQVSSGKSTVKVDETVLKNVEKALADAKLTPNGVFYEQGAQQNTVRVRFDPTQGEEQLLAREVIEKALNRQNRSGLYRCAEPCAQYALVAFENQRASDVPRP